MSACSGNPKNCSFCGDAQVDCAKSEVAGCLANPTAECTVCKGNGCVAKSCTGDIKTCPTCMGNFASCRKAEFSATEGIERAVKPADA